MKEDWILVGRYVAVIITTLLLGSILGHTELFEKTAVIAGKLSAAQMVRFLAFGGALVVFWMTVQRLAILFAHIGGRWGALTHVVLPLGTLITVSAAYGVLLIVLSPVMDASVKNIYNWAFIIGTLASAGWLVVAMFNQSSSLTEAIIGKVEAQK